MVLISSTADLLSSYDKKISDVTKLVLEQSRVEVWLGVRVVEVKKDRTRRRVLSRCHAVFGERASCSVASCRGTALSYPCRWTCARTSLRSALWSRTSSRAAATPGSVTGARASYSVASRRGMALSCPFRWTCAHTSWSSAI